MKAKKLISILLTLTMICSMFISVVPVTAEGEFTITADKDVNTALKVGDEVTYTFKVKNDTQAKADIVVKSVLDWNVEFVSATRDGMEEDGTVTWTLNEMSAGQEEVVSLTVKALEGALANEGGDGKISATVTMKVGEGEEITSNTVTHEVYPLPDFYLDYIDETDTSQYDDPILFAGDLVTYYIVAYNYLSTASDVTTKVELDPNVEYVSGGTLDPDNNVVTWVTENVGGVGSETHLNRSCKRHGN